MNNHKTENDLSLVPKSADWTDRVIELKECIQKSCGGPNVISSRVLADWDDKILNEEVSGQQLSRQLTMQQIITDYVINECLNQTLSDNDFQKICHQLRAPGGMDELYSKILILLAGSGQSFMNSKASPVETH